MITTLSEVVLKGVSICQGIAIGKPFWLTRQEEEVSDHNISPNEVEAEIERYKLAVQKASEELLSLHHHLAKEEVLEGAAIIESNLQILQDPVLTTQIEMHIRTSLKNAARVFYDCIKTYQKRFGDLNDPFFRERFKDLQDISQRVLALLRADSRISLSDIPPNSIIFSQSLSASDAAEANAASVLAFVSAMGGAASHAAIVAKACGIPYVSNIPIETLDQRQIDTVIVNGVTGDVILNPSPKTLKDHEAQRQAAEDQYRSLSEGQSLDAETFDGYSVLVSANIDTGSELHLMHSYGGSGVGLFRSEFVFLSHDDFPPEEEQYQVYKSIVERMHGLPIVIRTFDIGGDKFFRQPSQRESNPFLGCRAIRFLLKERDLFKTQLRAILRASAFGQVSILFPMVSCLSELLEAKTILKDVQLELARDNIPTSKVRIGCMIEVPSAAIISDLLARECDFLSIGTNDLVQYALAVDRDNHSLRGLYSPTDPSVLRLIKLVVAEANEQGIPVAICGEVAADPRFTPLLIGLGVHELSVASRYLPIVKKAIRSISVVDAHHLAEKALTLGTAQEVLDLLERT